MAVELNDLYAEIYSDYEIRLLTTSCFERKIGWVHVFEDAGFAYLMHGDELIFNSGLNYETEDGIKDFIEKLIQKKAGGLVVALEDGHTMPPGIIDYCNQMQFPLFRASWNTSFLDIMRRFAEILLYQERNETNLIGAMKNALYYPKDDKLYINHFEKNGFTQNMVYTIVILGYRPDASGQTNDKLKQIEKSLRYIIRKCVTYEENDQLIVLAADASVSYLKEEFSKICQRYAGLRVGIGSSQDKMQDLFHSYDNALATYHLASTAHAPQLLSYDELGVYQILTNVKDLSVRSALVESTLGKLMEYDKKNNTGYLQVLEAFFENECSPQNTAQALFCHKNTLYYKINAIKDILGYDIVKNENRLKIMLALHILKLGEL